jgi:CarboxypepD_reg-like domain/TonB-dependent Receptor Plug Domain
MKFFIIFIFTLIIPFQIYSQNTGNIIGKVTDKNTQESLPGAIITIENQNKSIATDIDGNYKFVLPVGSYTIKATYVGYKTITKFNVSLTSGNAQIINFELAENTSTLDEVTVKANKTKTAAASDAITPLSVQSLSTEEIRNNPGGNFDISRVIQALPGVAGTTASGGFRNDIILRGGSPNENIYYLDGIEIPVLNHFSTQGSAGGPAGIINTSFVQDIKLSTSAFNAQFDNSLSGVFEINQRDGNKESVQGNVRLSGSEFAAAFDGPINEKTSFLLSARRSYLQFLFKLIGLPIRPDFWDYQAKITHQINKKASLTFMGLGAIDNFRFEVPKEATAENIEIIRSNFLIKQWNYTGGVSLKYLVRNGYITAALSRNHLNNNLAKYEDNENPSKETQTFFSDSKEIENKLRLSVRKYAKGLSYSYGGVIQAVTYGNDFRSVIQKEQKNTSGIIIQPGINAVFNTKLNFMRYGLFGQIGKTFNNQVSISAGVRTDMNSFTTTGMNPLKTISPRISFSAPISDKIRFNASWGTYFKTPIYTVLGFKDNKGNFVNKNAEYVRSTHYTGGFEYLPKPDLRFTLEGFFKKYSHVPVSISNNISLANQGGDFGAIGNEAVKSVGLGNTYGMEAFIQQKLMKRQFVTLSYTYVISKFGGENQDLVASAWDNRHLLSFIYGLKFKKQFEIGLKYRFAGGSPYTPYDIAASQRNYLTRGTGILDYSKTNTLRLKPFTQLDVRIDKKWNYKKWTLDLYADISNITATKNDAIKPFTFKRNADNTAFATTDGKAINPDGSNAIPLILNNASGNLIPTIGFIIEF